jgi:hypothetical protein
MYIKYINTIFLLFEFNRIELFLTCVGKMWGKSSTFVAAF